MVGPRVASVPHGEAGVSGLDPALARNLGFRDDVTVCAVQEEHELRDGNAAHSLAHGALARGSCVEETFVPECDTRSF